MRWLLLLVAGCGRIGFDMQPSGDAARGFGPFGAPQVLSTVNSPSREFAVQISVDELELYFISNRASTFDCYRATRTSRDVDFDPPTLQLFGASSTADEPALATTLVEMYVSNRRVTRADRTSPWSAPVAEPVFATFKGEDFGARDLHMVMSDPSDTRLLESSRATLQGSWSTPIELTELQGASPYANYPTMTDDGLEIFIQAYDAPGGRGHILHATRTALDQPFGPTSEAITFAPNVSSGDPDISADGGALYFGSDLANPGGPSDLYVARRTK